jgi:hypothetical protein
LDDGLDGDQSYPEELMQAINVVESETAAFFLESTYGRATSVSYFELEHRGELCGVNSLVERSVLLNYTPMLPHLESNPLPIAEVDLQFQLAKLHIYLPKSLSAEFVKVYGNIMYMTREEFRASSDQHYHKKCHEPTTFQVVLAAYTCGKNCMLNHLPHLLVLQLDDKYT